MVTVLVARRSFRDYTHAYQVLGPTAIAVAAGRSNRWAVLIAKGRMLPSLASMFALDEHVGIPIESWRELARARRGE